LMVLDAKVNIQGAEGKRSVSVEDVFIGPGRTSLSPGEIITSFSLKKTGNGCGASYLKLSRTRGMDCAIVGVAAFVELGEEQLLKKARIAMASVGPVPLRARKAEGILAGSSASSEKIQESAVAASEEASPMDDMRASSSYRRKMTEVLTSRALKQAIQAAKDQRRGVAIDD
jgi:aerobic carbon-monoxide dehydrogenase medium subunit